jgi:hypothetical protein
MNRVKKGDTVSLTFFTRSDGFKGSGVRVLTGRCLFLKRRHNWVVMHFCVTFRYVKFIFKIPLHTPIITKLKVISKNDY